MKAFLFATSSASLVLSCALAENLLQNGGFELPAAAGRVASGDGGDPTRADPTPWESLGAIAPGNGGKLIAGMTAEIARTGKQSLFVDFQAFTAPSKSLSLATKLIPVKAQKPYRIGIWGRIDARRPLTMDERRPYMWMDIQFYKADRQTESGKSQFAVTMIPGAIVPGSVNELVFVSTRWNESVTTVETPPDTAFLQVTWTWGVPRDEGETDGTIFLDDASVEEAPPTPPSDPAASTKEPAANSPGSGSPAVPRKGPPVPAKDEEF